MTRKARSQENGESSTKTRHLPRAHPNHPVHRLQRSASKKNSRPKLTKFLHAKLLVPPFRKGVAPGHDFYAHINGQWLRNTPMPGHSSSFGVSEEVESYIQGFLLRDILECQKLAELGREQRTTEGVLRDAVGRLAMSSLRPEKQKFSLEYLKKGVRSLGCMRDGKDVATSIGTMCKYRVPTVLDITVTPKNSESYQLNIAPGAVGLSDVSYYGALAPGKSNVLYAYTNLVKQVTGRLDLDDVTHAIPLEAKFAAVLDRTKEEKLGIEYTIQELERKYNEIAWKPLLLAYGVPAERVPRLRIHVDSEIWLDFLNQQLKEMPLENWYSLFALHTLLHALPYLPPPFDDWHFSFFGRMLRGQRKKTPQDILTLNVIKKQMAPALGWLFVKHYLTAEFRTQATHFAEKIRDSAIKRMAEVEWLAPPTRKKAAEKLRRMQISAGWSEPLLERPPEPPPLQTDNLLANIYLLEAATTERQLGYLLRAAPKGLWEESPYSVNAFYFHDTNELVIPAGSFFWPFYSQDHAERKGWNYGGLGAVIGHEITHGFDQEGKEFGPSGREGTWWTAEDAAAYGERTKELVRLFGQAKVMGRAVNGASTLDENLADLGGLAIALDALKRELRDASAEERRRHLRDFFVAYAVSWRTKEHAERRLQRLILDKHAPIELRVNLVVSQFEEWYEAFGVRTDDTLYVPPEERIRIF